MFHRHFVGIISRIYSTQRVQNLLEITLSLMVLQVINIFHVQQIQDGSWNMKIKIFSHDILWRFCNIQKVQNLLKFSISSKIQDGGQNLENKFFFRNIISRVYSTRRVKNFLEIALLLKVFKLIHIFISSKVQDDSQNFCKIKKTRNRTPCW